MLGRRDDAPRALRRVLDGPPRAPPPTLPATAAAARALGQYKEANDLYRSAARLAPQDPAINTAWGELFLERYDRPEALKSFQAALKVDETYVPARLGLAGWRRRATRRRPRRPSSRRSRSTPIAWPLISARPSWRSTTPA